jgi:DNA polymerase-3 subunit gamma/tau
LAVQSIYQKNDKEVLLTVYQSEKHLDSKGLRDQLQRGLSLALNEPIELELQFTDEQFNTPLNIQRQIDAARLARAKELIYQDPLIVALQQQFGAEVYDDSIKPVG